MINTNLNIDNFWLTKALNIFKDTVIKQSDFIEENGDYVYLYDLIEILKNKGWNPIFASNTVINLIDTDYLNLFEDDLYWLEIS